MRCPSKLVELWGPPHVVDGQCVGSSETRGFGVCLDPWAWLIFECTRGDSEGTSDALMSCGLYYGPSEGTPCACLVLSPDDERGTAVPASVCRAYSDTQPGEARCVNASWEEL